MFSGATYVVREPTMASSAAKPVIDLRPAAPTDEGFLFELYCQVRAPEFAMLILPEEQKAQVIGMQYTAQRAAYQAQFPGSNYEIVLNAGQPVGRIWVDRGESDLFLVDVALLPACRNAGIGTWLIKQLQSEARAAGKPIRSSVFRFNPGSLRFHERLGFRVTHQDEVEFHLEWRPGQAGETARS
jgi:GNAT superfamily N-acetyltransferase